MIFQNIRYYLIYCNEIDRINTKEMAGGNIKKYPNQSLTLNFFPLRLPKCFISMADLHFLPSIKY